MTKKERALIKSRRLSYTTVKEREDKAAEKKRISETVALEIAKRFKSREFWTIVVDQKFEGFANHLATRYYSDVNPSDIIGLWASCDTVDKEGIQFLIISLRRRRLLAPDLAMEFENCFAVRAEPREIVKSPIIFACEEERIALASTVAGRLIEGKLEMDE